jgi:RNA polymerase sigma-70 factor, ECF subfamily
VAHLVVETATALSDEQLIVRVGRGDEPALALLYDRYGRLVYAVALRITQNQATAEEVVQDVFHAVWGSARSFQVGRSVHAWIIGITRHRAIDTTRTRNYQLYATALALTDIPFAAGGEIADAIAQAVVVREALDCLPREQRQVLELLYYKGFTCKSIAVLLGEPLGTIKGRLRLGLLKLHMLLRSA